MNLSRSAINHQATPVSDRRYAGAGTGTMAHVRRARSGRGWEARYRDVRGKERSRTLPTKREAEQFLRASPRTFTRGDYLDPRHSRTRFREWADQWLATTVHLKPKTRASYESILNARVLPQFGDMRIGAIDQAEVRRFIAELAEAGDKPGTIRNTFNVLRLVFGTALGSGAIRANPCTGVRMPKSLRTEMLFLTAEEVLTSPRQSPTSSGPSSPSPRTRDCGPARSAQCASVESTSSAAVSRSASRWRTSKASWCSVRQRPMPTAPCGYQRF